LEEGDRHRFMEKLEERVKRYQIRLYLFCLMPNHVHFLLETPLGNLPQFMDSVLTSYAVYFNKKHQRVGHLTQGRYGSLLVEGNEYLLKLTRYIHLNPAFTKVWKNKPIEERLAYIRDYRWSSYRSYAGFENPIGFVDYEAVWDLICQGSSKPFLSYRQYVESGLAESDEDFKKLLKRSTLGLGSEAFIAELEERYRRMNENGVCREDISFRRLKEKIPPSTILKMVCQHFGVSLDALVAHRKNDWIKPVMAELLTRLAGMTQREVACQMGLSSGAAVSLQLKRLKESGPAEIRQTLADLERKFNI